jgi:hypothetical protein
LEGGVGQASRRNLIVEETLAFVILKVLEEVDVGVGDLTVVHTHDGHEAFSSRV